VRPVLVGIIGGTGKMGTFFGEVFSRAGHVVLCAGRHTDVTPRDIARDCELVIVSVPIRQTVDVIDSIAPVLTEEQILSDLTSLKVMPVRAMLKSKARVLGMHPMFGPSVTSLLGQTIVVTPARCDNAAMEKVTSILRDQGARITQSTPGEHDRLMAIVQGLTHFVTLCVADTTRRMNIRPEETVPYMSPVYQMEMGLVGRLLGQDPSLYGDMLMMNPYVGPVLSACEESVKTLAGCINDENMDEFIELFQKNSRHFGEYCRTATEETDYLIESLVGR